ncbi:MAG: hypothetical protein L0Z50_08290 [Verrucomicrobiales bacterium]|nr:hypothetical protein [Verrucomicrobiales bacterium]
MSRRVVVNALKMSRQHFAHRQLPRLRGGDQIVKSGNEQVDSVRLKLLFSKRVPRSKVTANVIQRGTDFWQRNLMLSSDCVKNVRLDQVYERK